MTHQDLVKRTQQRLRCNLCRYPERSVRKAMLKDFPQMVATSAEPYNAEYENSLNNKGQTIAIKSGGRYCVDGIIRQAVRQNNDLYTNHSKSIRVLKDFDHIKGDRYIYLNK